MTKSAKIALALVSGVLLVNLGLFISMLVAPYKDPAVWHKGISFHHVVLGEASGYPYQHAIVAIPWYLPFPGMAKAIVAVAGPRSGIGAIAKGDGVRVFVTSSEISAGALDCLNPEVYGVKAQPDEVLSSFLPTCP